MKSTTQRFNVAWQCSSK